MKKLIFSLLLLFTIVGLSLADKTIVLAPGWNVVSTPKLLSGISFSNGGDGISFYTLSGSSWASIAPTAQTIKPLEGFVVNNSTSGNVIMSLLYKTNVNPMETLFQKNLNLGRNLLGITTITSPFTNIGNGAVMSVDFTKNTSNLLNGVNSSFTVNNSSSSIASPELGEAYGIFVTSSGTIYGGSQDTNSDTGNVQISGSANVSQILFSGEETVVLGASNIDILKFNIEAGSGGAITVKEIQAKIEYQNDGTGDWLPATENHLGGSTLYINGNPIKSANFTNGKINFNGLNSSILQNTGKQFLVKTSILNNQSSINDKLRIILLTGMIIEDADANNITPTGLPIIGNKIITVKDAGTVELANNSSAAQKSLYTAGSTNVELGKIDVKAQDDTVKLTDMYLKNSGTLDVANRINSPKLYYVDNGVETLLANGSIVGTTMVFENLDSANFKVNAATTKTLVVRANLNTVLNTGDLSSNTILIDLNASYADAKAGTVNGARFVSDSNGNTITTVTENYTANQHTVVRGAPELASAATTATNSRLMNFTTKAVTNEIKVKQFVSTISNVESGSALTITIYKDSVSSANKVAEGTGTVGSSNTATINLNSSVAAGYSISSNQTANFIAEVVGYSPKTNNGYAYTREFKITDVVYDDVFQNGTLTVSSINAFVNVGTLPLVTTYQP